MSNFVPCHLLSLFVKSDGSVFPCCQVWGRSDMRLGHVEDGDLVARINAFAPPPCRCASAVMRPGVEGETLAPEINLLHLELSLACQATCAMCSVDSPGWRGRYDLYPSLTALVKQTRPKNVVVQGGEVLIQRRSLDWIEALKEEIVPNSRFEVVTNGNVPEKDIERIASLFDIFTISIVGFQSETYSAIMGIDFQKTERFAATMIELGKEVHLKYLATALNIHETGAFTEWALAMRPYRVLLTDSNSVDYMVMDTSDSFWKKMLERAGDRLRQALRGKNDGPGAQVPLLVVGPLFSRHMGVDRAFVEQAGCAEVVVI